MATINGSDNSANIIATPDDDTIYGNGGNDNIQAGSGDDRVFGGADNDTLYGGDGFDSLYGGDGEDTLYGGNDDNFDDLYGGAGNDQIYTSDSEWNWAYGGDGDDTIQGGAGGDLLVGEADHDTLFGNDGTDSIYGGSGHDKIYGGAGGDTLYGEGDHDFIDGGSGDDTIDGGDGDDRIDGGSGDDELYAGAGDDTLYNGSGNDTVDGGDGNDRMFDGAGDDTLYGGSGNDTFEVDEEGETDIIVGGENTGDYDLIDFSTTASTGGVTVDFDGFESGTYSLVGTITSGSFSQIEAIIATEDGDDIDASASGEGQTLDMGAGNDIARGGTGNDSIFGGADDDSVLGGLGDDLVYGGTGNDFVDGGSGADTLFGGDGDDWFDSGTGNDTITTGSGEDTVRIEQVGGDDIVTDFDIGDQDGDGFYNDQFDVSDLQNPDGSPIRVGDVTVQDDGSGNAKLIFPEGESIVLQGVAPSQMSTGSQLHAAGIPCFTPGALIATPQGERAIETLKVGDKVMTRDHGMQAIRWVGHRTVQGRDRFAPVLIQPDVVTGLYKPLLVSPQHRMLFTGYRAELLFGETEVLVAAKHLIDGRMVTHQEVDAVTYIHILFDEHEVIYANGAATESFHPGEEGINAVDDAARDELFAIFPELRSDLTQYGQTARMCLRRREALMVQM